MRIFKAIRAYGAKVVTTVATFCVTAFVSVAHAAVPADVTTAFTDLLADGATFMTSVWGVVAIFVIGFTWIKLFKKGLGKST